MSTNIPSDISSLQTYTVVRPSFTLTTGLRRIDQFLGGFNSPSLAFFQGWFPMVNQLTCLLTVNAVKQFDKDVIFIDGGNSVDLYELSDISRLNDIDAEYVFSRTMVARAFTAYQLDSLIANIDAYIREFTPALLIINCITDLLFDRDVRDERDILLHRWLQLLNDYTRNGHLVSVVTTRQCDTCFSNLFEHAGCNKMVTFTRQRKSIKINLHHLHAILHYRPVPLYQRTIDDYYPEVDNG